MKSKKILLTGFEAFGGDNRNPSMEIAKAVKSNHSEVDILILPVEYENAFLFLLEKVKKGNYDFLIMLGLAKSRSKFELEHCAINFTDSSMADNCGALVLGTKIAEGAPDFLFADECFFGLEHENLKHSFHAGNFVCNHLYYKMLHENILKCVFIHVPWGEDLKSQQELNAKFLEIFFYCIKLV